MKFWIAKINPGVIEYAKYRYSLDHQAESCFFFSALAAAVLKL